MHVCVTGQLAISSVLIGRLAISVAIGRLTISCVIGRLAISAVIGQFLTISGVIGRLYYKVLFLSLYLIF